MKKDRPQELLMLYAYDELTKQERLKVETYLRAHPEMQDEIDRVKKFKTVISKNVSGEIPQQLLSNVRSRLHDSLRSHRSHVSFSLTVKEFMTRWIPPAYAMSITAVFLFSAGLAAGYLLFQPNGSNMYDLMHASKNNGGDNTAAKITNIRFIDTNAGEGEIEFDFDAVAPMHVKGKIDDPGVQKILTHALLDESNAGVRISTVNAIGRQTENKQEVDPIVKNALLQSLKNDENPGVRREALRVLQHYPFDNTIRDAVLNVLLHDKNAGLRVAAVNALNTAQMEGHQLDKQSISTLKNHIRQEENNYVRQRTATLVQEVYQ